MMKHRNRNISINPVKSTWVKSLFYDRKEVVHLKWTKKLLCTTRFSMGFFFTNYLNGKASNVSVFANDT